MIQFLLFTSLILNVIALFCIVILYLRQNRFLQVEKKQEKLMAEMEDLISTYLVEMKEENEKFIEKVNKVNKMERKRITKEPEKIKESYSVDKKSTIVKAEMAKTTQKESALNESVVDPPLFPKGNKFQAVQAYKSSFQTATEDSYSKGTQEPPPKKPDLPLIEQQSEPKEDPHRSSDLYMQSLLNQALLLQKQGIEIEEIAKKLNKGKTEIELLLKFRQKEKE